MIARIPPRALVGAIAALVAALFVVVVLVLAVISGISAIHCDRAPAPAPTSHYPQLGQRDVRLLIVLHLADRRQACAEPALALDLRCAGDCERQVPYPELIVPCLRQLDLLPCALAASWDGIAVIGAPSAPRLCVGAVGGGVAFSHDELDAALHGERL